MQYALWRREVVARVLTLRGPRTRKPTKDEFNDTIDFLVNQYLSNMEQIIMQRSLILAMDKRLSGIETEALTEVLTSANEELETQLKQSFSAAAVAAAAAASAMPSPSARAPAAPAASARTAAPSQPAPAAASMAPAPPVHLNAAAASASAPAPSSTTTAAVPVSTAAPPAARRSAEGSAEAPSLPLAASPLATSIHQFGLMALGGRSTTSRLGTIEVYDPVIRQWFKWRSMPSVRSGGWGCWWRHRIVVGGGRNAEEPLKTAQIYQPMVRKWGELPLMLSTRLDCAGDAVGDHIVVRHRFMPACFVVINPPLGRPMPTGCRRPTQQRYQLHC